MWEKDDQLPAALQNGTREQTLKNLRYILSRVEVQLNMNHLVQ